MARFAKLVGAAVLVLALVSSGGAAKAIRIRSDGAPIELSVGNLQTPYGNLAKLKAGSTYSAGGFPLALRITPPDAAWGGSQWTTGSHGKRAFGWAAVGRVPLMNPLGDVVFETGYGSTPSVAATLARLRVGGSHDPSSNVGGTSFGAPSPVTIAGYSGMQFDGNVWGIYGHVFVPFTPKTHGASPPDSFRLTRGESFRVIVLDVKGKSVVFFVESFALPSDQFPTFLAAAGRILSTLRFSTR